MKKPGTSGTGNSASDVRAFKPRALGSSLASYKLDVAHPCSPSAQEVEAGEPQFQHNLCSIKGTGTP